MIEKIQKLDNLSKFSLLSSSLGFAVLVLLIYNILDSIMYMLLLIQEPTFENISLSFQDGHYTINDKKMGFSIFYNVLIVLFLWIVMVYYNLKSMDKADWKNSFF